MTKNKLTLKEQSKLLKLMKINKNKIHKIKFSGQELINIHNICGEFLKQVNKDIDKEIKRFKKTGKRNIEKLTLMASVGLRTSAIILKIDNILTK
jgi:hypothetical protein